MSKGCVGVVVAISLGAASANGCSGGAFGGPETDAGSGGVDDHAGSGTGGTPSPAEGGSPEAEGGAPPKAPKPSGGSPGLPAGGSDGGSMAGSPVAAGGDPPTDAGAGGGSGGPEEPAPLVVKAYDDFVESAEGWTVAGDPVLATATFVVDGGTNGKNDGSISFTDGGTPTWYFVAPEKYHGDASALLGGVLRFDLKITLADDPFGNPDVQLTNGPLALTVSYDCSPDPGTSWKTFTVPLSAAGWKLGTSLSGDPVTEEDFRKVLSNITRVRIRGEFNTGADTGWLDNVYFASRLPN
jgi:hypothetical protein